MFYNILDKENRVFSYAQALSMILDDDFDSGSDWNESEDEDYHNQEDSLSMNSLLEVQELQRDPLDVAQD